MVGRGFGGLVVRASLWSGLWLGFVFGGWVWRSGGLGFGVGLFLGDVGWGLGDGLVRGAVCVRVGV